MREKSKCVFLTSTMASRSNGPANFAMNLFHRQNKNYTFITEDSGPYADIVKVNVLLSSLFYPISMVIKGYEYSRILNKTDYEIAIWNFSVLSWFAQLFNYSGKKHFVFVNDSLSLDNKMSFRYKSLRYGIFRVFEKYACKKANLIIVNSRIIKQKIQCQYNLPASKVKILYKGVNLEELEKPKIDFFIGNDSSINISFVKTNYVIGGLSNLCKALAEIKNRKFIINVYGPDEVEIIQHFSNVEIVVHGKLDKAQLYKQLINSDFFCTPCKVEAYGQANMEALALQIPTVILPIDYQLDLHSSDYCWIPKDLTTNALKKTIQEIIGSPEERKQKAILARKVISQKYSLEVCIESLKSFLNN